MIRLAMLIFGLLLVCGCTHVPFQKTVDASYDAVEPQGVLDQFRANAPESFQLLNSVVFEYSWNSFMGIGYIDINRQNGIFRVVCLNPLGVQLFELSGDRNSIETHFVMPAMMEYGDLPKAVGTDIRRIYFDLVPSAGARTWKSGHKMNFWQTYGPGEMEFEYAGSRRDLVEKVYHENNEIIWRISYYEYREHNGKRFPQGIVMINYKYGYQLTVRQKEVYS